MNSTSPPKSTELQRLERLGAALGKLDRNGDTWKAIEELLSTNLDDARQMAHNPDLPEDKRGFWTGADYALFDLGKELIELQSGAWKQWANVIQMRQLAGEED